MGDLSTVRNALPRVNIELHCVLCESLFHRLPDPQHRGNHWSNRTRIARITNHDKRGICKRFLDGAGLLGCQYELMVAKSVICVEKTPIRIVSQNTHSNGDHRVNVVSNILRFDNGAPRLAPANGNNKFFSSGFYPVKPRRHRKSSRIFLLRLLKAIVRIKSLRKHKKAGQSKHKSNSRENAFLKHGC